MGVRWAVHEDVLFEWLCVELFMKMCCLNGCTLSCSWRWLCCLNGCKLSCSRRCVVWMTVRWAVHEDVLFEKVCMKKCSLNGYTLSCAYRFVVSMLYVKLCIKMCCLNGLDVEHGMKMCCLNGCTLSCSWGSAVSMVAHWAAVHDWICAVWS